MKNFNLKSLPYLVLKNDFEEIKNINQKIAANKSNDSKDLYQLRNSLEKDLYQAIPELEINTVEVAEIASLLEKDSLLIEFQKYFCKHK